MRVSPICAAGRRLGLWPPRAPLVGWQVAQHFTLTRSGAAQAASPPRRPRCCLQGSPSPALGVSAAAAAALPCRTRWRCPLATEAPQQAVGPVHQHGAERPAPSVAQANSVCRLRWCQDAA
jgi:hypothetical protein